MYNLLISQWSAEINDRVVNKLINYFELYRTCLKVIAEKHPEQTQDFMAMMNNEPIIKTELDKGIRSELLVQAVFEVLDNLTDDGLVKASKKKTKVEGTIYFFNGLSTIGHQYLESLNDPTFIEKLKSTLKDEGVPLTPTAITKFIAKLTL